MEWYIPIPQKTLDALATEVYLCGAPTEGIILKGKMYPVVIGDTLLNFYISIPRIGPQLPNYILQVKEKYFLLLDSFLYYYLAKAQNTYNYQKKH